MSIAAITATWKPSVTPWRLWLVRCSEGAWHWSQRERRRGMNTIKTGREPIAPASAPAPPPKVQPRHLDRLAAVYVRQSTAQQVLEHQESTALQYALRARAVGWGWPPERVLVIDEDL